MIITISGFSGVGKDVIAKRLSEIGYEFVISHSTRPMRNGESQGDPYHFISFEKMMELRLKKQLLEMRSYHTLVGNLPKIWYYGLHKDTIQPKKDYVVVLDLKGVVALKEHFGDRVKSLFINVDDELRFIRANNREENMDVVEWSRRLSDDLTNFTEEYIYKICDDVVTNNTTIDECFESVCNWIEHEKSL